MNADSLTAVLDDIHMSQSLPAECKLFETDMNAPPTGKTTKHPPQSIDGVEAQQTRNHADTTVFTVFVVGAALLVKVILTI